MFQIEHSGRTWTALRFDGGVPVWPIEEFLARCGTKYGPRALTAEEAERLRRLNPDGKREGEAPIGWQP